MSENDVVNESTGVSRRRLLKSVGLVGVTAGALGAPELASARPQRRSAGKDYTIGCSFPLTGPLASDGEQMKNGVTLAADEINAAGGIAGSKIKLSIVCPSDVVILVSWRPIRSCSPCLRCAAVGARSRARAPRARRP